MNNEYALRVNYIMDLGFENFGKRPIWRRFTMICLLCYKWITHWFLVNAAWRFRWIFELWMPSCEVIFHDPKLGPEYRLRSLSSTWIFLVLPLLVFFIALDKGSSIISKWSAFNELGAALLFQRKLALSLSGLLQFSFILHCSREQWRRCCLRSIFFVLLLNLWHKHNLCLVLSE